MVEVPEVANPTQCPPDTSSVGKRRVFLPPSATMSTSLADAFNLSWLSLLLSPCGRRDRQGPVLSFVAAGSPRVTASAPACIAGRETSCEATNLHLDRALLVEAIATPAAQFFIELNGYFRGSAGTLA